MILDGKRKPVRQTILSFFGGFVLLMILSSSAFIGFIVYKIETTIWQERRLDATDNAANTILSFLDRMENLLIFAVRDLDSHSGHDREELSLLLDSDPAFYEIIQVDSSGNIINAVAKGDVVLANSFTVRQANWFSKVKQGGIYIGSVEYTSEGEPFVIVAVCSQANLILTARIGMSVLSQIVEQIKLGSSGRIFVVDQTGYILAHPDRNMMEGYANIASNPYLSNALTFIGDIWQGRYNNLQGKNVLGTARRIGDTGWIVIAEIDEFEAFQNSRITWLVQLAGIILLSTAAMFFTARSLDRWIFLPLNALRNGAEEIQLGDLSKRVPILRVDEIGDRSHI